MFNYNKINDSEIILTEYLGDEKVLTIPAYIDGFKVVKIKSFCFLESEIEEITIPDNINLDNNVFIGCDDLTKINKTNLTEWELLKIIDDCHSIEHIETEFEQNDFKLRINIKGEISLIKYIGDKSFLNIPKTMNNLLVTKIEDKCFLDCLRLKEVILSDFIEEIGENAFCNTGIKSINIPNGVKLIEKGVFSNCRDLVSVILPNSVKEIKENAFSNTGIKSINIPDGVKVIEKRVFSNCRDLVSVVLPNSVKEIEKYAFCNTDIESIKIPDGIEVIEKSAFSNCENLKEVHLP